MAAKGSKKADLAGLPKGTRVRIEHPDSGKAYGVSVKAFERIYEERGFRVVGLEDGSPLQFTEAEEAAAEATKEAEKSAAAGEAPAE